MNPFSIVVTLAIVLSLLYVLYDLSPYGQVKKLEKAMGVKHPTEDEVSEYAYQLKKNHQALFSKAASEPDPYVRQALTSETGRALGDYLHFKLIARRSGYIVEDS